MSMVRVFCGSRASNSSGVIVTYLSGPISYPLMICSYGISSPDSGLIRCWRMRWPDSASSWWKRTVLRETALYSFTGMLTSPKLIAPLQIALGMPSNLLGSARLAFLAHAFLRVHVVAQPLERGRAHRAALGPLAQLHAGHQPRVD